MTWSLEDAGKFRPGDSFWHNLDPRTKIAIPFLQAFFLILLPKFPVLWLDIFLFVLLVWIGRLPPDRLLVPVYGLRWLIGITIITHLLLIPGKAVIPGWPGTTEGLVSGLMMTGRLIGMLIAAQLLMITTPPLVIAKGLEKILSPLPRLRPLAAKFALILALTLRFVPILMMEWRKIRDSAIVRGYLRPKMSLRKRFIKEATLMVPLFINAYRRAEDMAISMHLRGFRPETPRTNFRPLAFKPADGLAMGAVALLGIVMVIL